MFSKQHYIEIAKLLRSDETIDFKSILRFCDLFTTDNNKFNRTKFLLAVGFSKGEIAILPKMATTSDTKIATVPKVGL
jgi:hypothetical protein